MIIETKKEAGLAFPGLLLYDMKFFKSGNTQHIFYTKESSFRIWRETKVSGVKLKVNVCQPINPVWFLSAGPFCF